MMKWFVLVVFLICYGGRVEMGALKKGASTSTEASVYDEEDSSPPSPLGAECLVGSAWRDACNECRCTRAGRRACTERACPPDNGPPHQPVMCAPNTTWTNPCAECSCSPEGVPGCYLKTCSHLMGTIESNVAGEIKDLPPKTIPLKKLNHSEAECLPGTFWRSACHSCRCSEQAAAECVKIPDCSDQEGEPIRCQPESTFARECNWCRCLESGLVLCTLKECAPFRQVEEEVLGVGKQCEVGTGWRSGCSSCRCESSGEAYCTLDACAGRERQHTMRCAPGTKWRDGCRRCDCGDDGTAACAEALCGEGRRQDALDTSLGVGKECEVGTGWQNGCNKCHCSEDGRAYCTVNRCPTEVDDEVSMQCAPGSRWQYECNGCYCTAEGRPRCTVMDCYDEGTSSVSNINNLKKSKPANLESAASSNKTVVCRANSMFVRDCNTCWCNDDGTTYFCTRRACVPNTPEEVVGVEDVKPEDLVRVPQRDCRPDEVFEIDCNVCRCNPDGESFSCTRRLCARDPPTVGVAEVYPDEQNTTLTRRPRRQVNSKGLVKTCLPGQEFRVDCNKCLCDNEGQDFSCTRLDCAALNNHNGGTRNKREVVQQAVNHCEPGTVFDQGCNVCRCTSDGRHATCSLKKCSIKPSEEEESQSDPNFRCTPGEQFTRTCNDCTCSADGLAVFCTLRLCENDIAGKI